MSEKCILLFGIMPLCVGDYVRIYPRGMRSMIIITGRITSIGDNAIMIETRSGSLLVIRLSEIRMAEKIPAEGGAP